MGSRRMMQALRAQGFAVGRERETINEAIEFTCKTQTQIAGDNQQQTFLSRSREPVEPAFQPT